MIIMCIFAAFMIIAGMTLFAFAFVPVQDDHCVPSHTPAAVIVKHDANECTTKTTYNRMFLLGLLLIPSGMLLIYAAIRWKCWVDANSKRQYLNGWFFMGETLAALFRW